jgi:hypothetical protein
LVACTERVLRSLPFARLLSMRWQCKGRTCVAGEAFGMQIEEEQGKKCVGELEVLSWQLGERGGKLPGPSKA